MREKKISDFCKGLAPVGRILEDPDHYVWGCSPIYGPDGRIHVFYSKWPNAAGFGGWLTKVPMKSWTMPSKAGAAMGGIR
ncbi:MAG: hypothetical protein ACYSN9_06955 [Planctomycetota bacterium]|jgi:hypothetical protein